MSEHDQIIKMANDLTARSSQMRGWEIDLLEEVIETLAVGHSPSVFQAEKLHEIWERL